MWCVYKDKIKQKTHKDKLYIMKYNYYDYK